MNICILVLVIRHQIVPLPGRIICRLWLVCLYYILPRYFINRKFSWGEKKLNVKCVFWFYLLSETFLILKRLQRYIITNIHFLFKVSVIIARF